MGKSRKTVLKSFGYRNCDDFAAYLNHMARQGWHFKEWRAGLVFEKGDPEDAFYAVEVFSGADDTDTRPEPKTQEFAEYCEAAGWQFVDSRGKYVTFKRLREDAVPIMTDGERLESITKAESHWVWRSLILSGIWCVMQILEFRSGFKYSIFRNRELIVASAWFLLFILASAQAIQFLIWKRRCAQRIDRGLRLVFGRDNSDRWYMWVYLGILACELIALAWVGQGWISLIMLGMVATLILLALFVSRIRPDNTVSYMMMSLGGVAVFLVALTAFTYAAQAENQLNQNIVEPPAVYADIWDDPGEAEEIYSKRYESVFGSWNVCRLDYPDAELSYEVFRSDYDWVLDEVWRGIMKGRATRAGTDCTALWAAEIAILSSDSSYKVRFDDTILDIRCHRHPLTEADIAAIVAALQLR